MHPDECVWAEPLLSPEGQFVTCGEGMFSLLPSEHKDLIPTVSFNAFMQQRKHLLTAVCLCRHVLLLGAN